MGDVRASAPSAARTTGRRRRGGGNAGRADRPLCSTAGPTSRPARRSSISRAGRPTGPTLRSSPSRRSTRRSATPRGRNVRNSSNGSTTSSSGSAFDARRGLDGSRRRARGARPGPDGSQPQCRLCDRQGRARDWPRLDAEGGPAARGGDGLGGGGREARGSSALLPGALLPPSERGPACADFSSRRGRKVVAASAIRGRMSGGGFERCGRRNPRRNRPRRPSKRAFDGGFLPSSGLGPSSPEARHVARRQDRFAFREEPLDPRGCAGCHLERARADISSGRGTYEPIGQSRRPLLGWMKSAASSELTAAAVTAGPARLAGGIIRSDVHRSADEAFRSRLRFLTADLVDRPPSSIGRRSYREGKSSIGYIGLICLAEAHRRWRLADSRMLGIDRLEVYERERDELEP